MRGYKIVEKDGKWYFELYPIRPKDQMIGQSRAFDSNLECAQAVRQFRSLVLDNLINSADSPFVRLVTDNDGMRAEYLLDGDMIFATRYYHSVSPRQTCKKSVVSIYQHIDDYTLRQVD